MNRRDYERQLITRADGYAHSYLDGVDDRPAFPPAAAIERLSSFDEPLTDDGQPAEETVDLLHSHGSPATVGSNGPHYFGFVIGASLPAAAAAERMILAWDQCASGWVNSPIAAKLEQIASRWMLDILDLPRSSAVAFGTSATACGLGCIAAARSALLDRAGWNLMEDGLHGAPPIDVVVSETVHISLKKILRLLGFGARQITFAPVDAHGRINPAKLPSIGPRTLLCLQAGEVNTGEFDPFEALIGPARERGAWVHVDGAFGLWARACRRLHHLTEGIDAADSWTTDGHKWLNTPYDCAMAVCRDGERLSATMNADAPYATAESFAQKNLTTEFSRRPRGISAWAALRTLGRRGVDEMVDRHCRQAQRLADGLRRHGLHVLNRVVLNQVLARAETDAQTERLMRAVQNDGRIWFGPGRWKGAAAFRLSVSSWRTTDDDIDRAIEIVGEHLKRN